jgi:hypothetical protein
MTTNSASRAKLSGPERIQQSDRTACRVIGGKAVVITIDHNEVHVFNSVGTRVWALCDGRPVSEIVDEIVLEFDVDRAQAAPDVYGFAERLLDVGAARIAQGGSA